MGPAGTTAAQITARAGYRTIIFEEDKAIGIPVQCGEGVSDYAFRNFGLKARLDYDSTSIWPAELLSLVLKFAPLPE